MQDAGGIDGLIQIPVAIQIVPSNDYTPQCDSFLNTTRYLSEYSMKVGDQLFPRSTVLATDGDEAPFGIANYAFAGESSLNLPIRQYLGIIF